MEENKRRSRNAEMEDFWDIDALIPPRRAAHYARDTEAVEIVLEPRDGEPRSAAATVPPRENPPERHFIPPHTKDEARNAPPPDVEYTPENSLIRTVRLYRQKSPYPYYEDFVRDAMRLHSVHGAECQHVTFFSYVPQYSQMNRSQLEWYLWWREQFSRGENVTADYSYLLLYAYEQINLAGRIDPAQARDALCRVWLGYRDMFRQLDAYIPDWIVDLCLIHRLPPPPMLDGQSLSVAMSRATLKEFYIAALGEEGLVRALPLLCSNYDFHKSKFCTKENKPLFERVIYGTLREIGYKTGKNGGLFDTDTMDTSRMVRASYQGALCATSNKRKIAVEYTSFSCSHELRYTVTDIIKYTENCIRAHVGVRSRLSVYALSADMRAMIDAYLTEVLPKRESAAIKKAEEPAAYEKLYDLPRAALSLSNALEIERASWDTTEQLIEAFDGEEEETVEMPAPLPVAPTEKAPACDLRNALQPYAAFLRATLDEDFAEQRALARQMGKMPDAVADVINEIATEYTGDVLLEDAGDGYAVIADYRDQTLSLIE